MQTDNAHNNSWREQGKLLRRQRNCVITMTVVHHKPHEPDCNKQSDASYDHSMAMTNDKVLHNDTVACGVVAGAHPANSLA